MNGSTHARQIGIDGRIGFVMDKCRLSPVEKVQPCRQGTYPEAPPGVFPDLPYPVVPDGGAVCFVVTVVPEGLPVEAIHTPVIGADPKLLFMIDEEADDDIIAQAIRVCGVVLIAGIFTR